MSDTTSITRSEKAQWPSNPQETSAARAFLQLDPTTQRKLIEEQRVNKSKQSVPIDIQKQLDSLYSAYYLTEEQKKPRDESGDLFTFEIVEGLFKQSDKKVTKPTPEEMLQGSFGLMDTSPQRWHNLKERIAALQNEAPDNVSYKLLFCGRHGQGWHNFGCAKYDPISWESHWCKEDGDGEIVWGPDPELTELGESQALAVQAGWKQQLADGAPKPEKWLCSPLTRTADTMRLSFGDILDGQVPVFKEGLREILGEHSCDKRRTKSYLHKRFPQYAFEDGFSEQDPLWKPDERESEWDRRTRLRNAMFDVFANQPETYISITSHACALQSLLAVLHHRQISLATGEMIPLVVKATRQH